MPTPDGFWSGAGRIAVPLEHMMRLTWGHRPPTNALCRLMPNHQPFQVQTTFSPSGVGETDRTFRNFPHSG